MKQNAKICAIVEQNVINEVFILGGQIIEKEGMVVERGEERGLRKGAERGYRDSEKRDKRELS